MSSPGSSSEYFRKIPYKQDVAPPGGYKKIPIGPNLPVKIPLSGVRLALAVGGITALGWARFWYGAKQYRKLREEKNIARLSLIPFLLAEQDRAMLKKMRAEYDEEALIMADVPGWVVGDSPYHRNPTWQEPMYYIDIDEDWIDIKMKKVKNFLFRD